MFLIHIIIMKNFFQWLFGSARPEPQQAQATGKKMNNVSADGLSAEKNVLKSIRRKTGASLSDIRDYLSLDVFYWEYNSRPGDKQRYFDQATRAAMIDVCVKHFGTRK